LRGSGIHQARAIAGLSSVVLVLLMAQPRVFFSMARDGLLPAHCPRASAFQDTVHTDDSHRVCRGNGVSIFPINILATGSSAHYWHLSSFASALVLRLPHPEIRACSAHLGSVRPIAAPRDHAQMVFYRLNLDTPLCLDGDRHRHYFFYSRKHSRLRIYRRKSDSGNPV